MGETKNDQDVESDAKEVDSSLSEENDIQESASDQKVEEEMDPTKIDLSESKSEQQQPSQEMENDVSLSDDNEVQEKQSLDVDESGQVKKTLIFLAHITLGLGNRWRIERKDSERNCD